MPKFWDRIASEYNVSLAHQFLLHLNVQDLANDELLILIAKLEQIAI